MYRYCMYIGTLAALGEPDLDAVLGPQDDEWHHVYWVRGIHARHEATQPQREHGLLFVQRKVLANAAARLLGPCG